MRVDITGNENVTENRFYEMLVFYKSGGLREVDHCEVIWGWNKHTKPEGIYVDPQTFEYYRLVHLSSPIPEKL